MGIPGYLTPYADEYGLDPKGANLKWFSNAKAGLFMHFGLYSLLGRADMGRILADIGMPNAAPCRQMGREWAQYLYKIPVRKYERLARMFKPDAFDASAIVRFAKECGLDYINLTTRHHDSFCLWDAADTPFNAMRATGRDLVRELYEACERERMALFLYYSHGRDWRHPHAPNNDEWGGDARPEYDPPEPCYAYAGAHDINIYVDFVKRQILELLTLFPNIAGIWLDGIAVAQNGNTESLRIPELYAAIRTASPHALISYKQGIIGTEDFFAPETRVPDANADAKHRGKIRAGAPIEVCATISHSWGYVEGAPCMPAQKLMRAYEDANQNGYKLLLNLAPSDAGALNPNEMDALLRARDQIHI